MNIWLGAGWDTTDIKVIDAVRKVWLREGGSGVRDQGSGRTGARRGFAAVATTRGPQKYEGRTKLALNAVHPYAPIPDPRPLTPDPYFPIQNVEKMRFRMSSAVVAPVMASMGRSAA